MGLSIESYPCTRPTLWRAWNFWRRLEIEKVSKHCDIFVLEPPEFNQIRENQTLSEANSTSLQSPLGEGSTLFNGCLHCAFCANEYFVDMRGGKGNNFWDNI